jgi:hypothetical protein
VIGDYNTVQIKTDDGTDLGPAMTEAAFEDAGTIRAVLLQ